MQIELLETFLDLIETRSFHKTAERLGVTQSTVSARVVALEAAIGGRLLNRSRAGSDLTTAGLRFEQHARILRQEWNEARRAVAPAGETALTLRIGIQNDLAAGHIGEWVADFRRALPDCAFYIEPDYSAQMSKDLERGVLDFAVLYSPQSLPDLHVATLGDVQYRLISSDADRKAGLKPERYIRGAYAPAFDAAHRQLLPEMVEAPLASGQNSAVVGLLGALGGAGFVLAEAAKAMVESGAFAYVADVGPIAQPVFAAMHLRHRTSRMHRRLTRMVLRRLNAH